MHGAWCASYGRKTPYYYNSTYGARFRAIHAWMEHDPCIIEYNPHEACAGRRKQVDDAGGCRRMVVACACRDSMAARRKESLVHKRLRPH